MKALFFCENCGKEVRPGASTCPWCGRGFKAVRCPECGFEGKASEFRFGCPTCGFNEQPQPAPALTPPRRGRRPLLSVRFYRISGVILLVLLALLLVLFFLRA